MNKEGLSKLVDYELEWRRKQKTDREVILALYNKFKNQNLSYNEIIQRIIKEFLDIGFDEDYWKQKIERVLFSGGLVDKKSNVENEIEKSVKLTKDEYKELLEKEDFSNRPLPDKYYKNPDYGIFFAQFHFQGISPEEYKRYKEGKIPLWRTLINHSMHVDHRSKFNKRKELLQFVLTEDSIDSYLRVMRGERDPETNNIAKALVIIKPSAESKRIIREKEKKDMLLNSDDAKKASEYIIEKSSYWILPGNVGATMDTYSYMATIVTGKVQSGIMRSDYKELFTEPDKSLPTKNQELFKNRWIFKAFKKPRYLWWCWEAIKTPIGGNPYCECDEGNYVLHPAEKLDKFKKEEYPEWKTRKENC